MQWRKSVLPLVVLALGAGAAWLVISHEPGEASEPASSKQPPEVEVVHIEPTRRPAQVRGSGRVQAARKLPLSAEVGGRVVHVAEALEPGGRLQEDQLLVRIDPRDYRAALASRRAELAKAKLALEQAEASRDVAELSHERSELGDGTPSELALKGPQVRARRVRVEAAKAAVRRARTDLQRTQVRAPWDAAVVSADVDEGQQVSPGQPLAQLVGVERFWVQVAVPVSKLQWLELREDDQGEGSLARLALRTEQGEELVLQGRLVRRIPALAEGTQRALVLVEVREPLAGQAPLLPGAHVDVHIEGEPIDGVVPVPASALHDGRFVWRVDEEGRLERVEVEVAFTPAERPQEVVLAPGALSAGDRVVTSRLPRALEGSAVRVAGASPGPGEG